MTEQLRQHYLKALGIESYLPRWVLPGAAASPACDLPIEEEEQAETESSPVAVDVERVTAAALAGNAADVRARDEKTPFSDNLFGETKKARASQRPAPTALARPTPQHRFTLSAWRIAQSVMVLDSRQLQLALPVEQLLLNMSRALGLAQSGLPRGELLRWPLLENSTDNVAQSVEQARGMVHAYLAAQHDKQPVDTVLLMGRDAARHALSAADFDSVDQAFVEPSITHLLGKTFYVPRGEVVPGGQSLEGNTETGGSETAALRAIVLPSLVALLQKPSLKALVWKAIKPLRVSG